MTRAPLSRIACIAVAGLVAGTSVLAGSAPPARAQGCPPQPGTLSSGGSAAKRYTMLLRVNQVRNARTYANHEEATGGLGSRVHPQDVFVVNTRFPRSTPAEWFEIVSVLASAFPCNRIVALNGLGADPNAPGYAHALNESPRLWAMLTDWERDDWNVGRATNPRMKGWTGRFRKTRKRVRRWIGGLSRGFGPHAAVRRAGIAPQFRKKWDYGELARSVSGPNRRLDRGRRGVQSIQTQDFCADRGGAGMKSVTRRLMRAYKSANFRRVAVKRGGRRRVRHLKRRWRTTRANLGLQISFSDTPNPSAGMAVLRTSAWRAAGCTRSVLRRGGGAILYWASPNAMRLLFSIPPVCTLRPPPNGVC